MPGFGLSQFSDDIPASQTLRARYLWGVLDAFDMELEDKLSNWHLIGHGSACGTIAQMALQEPDSAASLFMISPMLYSPIPRAVMPLVRSKALDGLLRNWMLSRIVPTRRFRKLLTRVYGRAPRDDQVERMHRPLLRLVGHEDTVRRLLIEGYDLDTSALSSLFPPAMVIWGGRDRMLGGDVPRRLRTRDFPKAEYHVLPSAGHCAMETSSRAVRDFLRGWIREVWD